MPGVKESGGGGYNNRQMNAPGPFLIIGIGIWVVLALGAWMVLFVRRQSASLRATVAGGVDALQRDLTQGVNKAQEGLLSQMEIVQTGQSRLTERMDTLQGELSRRLETIERRVRPLQLQVETQNKALADLVGRLENVSRTTAEERGNLLRTLSADLLAPSRAFVMGKFLVMNAAAQSDAIRFLGYMERIEKGDRFTPQEVADYQRIASGLRRDGDGENDERVAAVGLLGAFLDALFSMDAKKSS